MESKDRTNEKPRPLAGGLSNVGRMAKRFGLTAMALLTIAMTTEGCQKDYYRCMQECRSKWLNPGEAGCRGQCNHTVNFGCSVKPR